MKLLDLIKYRRSIRKYSDKQIGRSDLEMIIEAGIYAPNAGGGQRTIIIGIHNKSLVEHIGKMNLNTFDRGNLSGSHVSIEQPSIIDDSTIKNAFYGAPTACVIFAPKNFIYSVQDSFCCAENMILQAIDLGISSCIVARGEKTFANEEGEKLLKKWNIPNNYVAYCFVLLGYCKGDYPTAKERKLTRYNIIE